MKNLFRILILLAMASMAMAQSTTVTLQPQAAGPVTAHWAVMARAADMLLQPRSKAGRMSRA